jgi:hypothetical protein
VISDKSTALVASGSAGLTLLTAWHVKCTAAAVLNIRKDGSGGAIIVPLKLSTDQCVGETYENALQGSDWYLEVVSGTVVASMSGRA